MRKSRFWTFHSTNMQPLSPTDILTLFFGHCIVNLFHLNKQIYGEKRILVSLRNFKKTWGFPLMRTKFSLYICKIQNFTCIKVKIMTIWESSQKSFRLKLYISTLMYAIEKHNKILLKKSLLTSLSKLTKY